MADRSLPLSGVLVVALEQAVAAPLASRQLADWGARVVKIERPGTGDFARGYDDRVLGLSSYFVWLNRTKESLTLDLKRVEAVEVVRRLLARSDVFLHNLAPGAVDRLGLSSSTLRASHPRLVTCAISGYGSSGPYRDRKAYDLLVQSEAGLLSVTGTPEAPSKAGISVADIAAGSCACSAILAALVARARTGEGAAIEVSMLEALGEWMGHPYYYSVYGGAPLARSGAHHASIAPYGPYGGRDGECVYLGIQNQREWQAFCERVLERPALVRDPRFDTNARRVEHRELLGEIIAAAFERWTALEIEERLDAAGIAYARMNTVEEFARHPQLEARRRWRDVGSPAGPIRALVPPATVEGLDPAMGPVPALGAHTETILAELGYDAQTIERWKGEGVI
jgi:itaconate CoA-transferase